jgi:hypothetical protein
MPQKTLPPPDYRLPCDIRLPGGLIIARGCTLATLTTAIQRREGREGWQVTFDEPIPYDRSLLRLFPAPAGEHGEQMGQPILLADHVTSNKSETPQPSAEWVRAHTPDICRGTGRQTSLCNCLFCSKLPRP